MENEVENMENEACPAVGGDHTHKQLLSLYIFNLPPPLLDFEISYFSRCFPPTP